MDMLYVIVMLILFLFLLIFIFSTALLTPLIGKKNLVFVLSLGFVVGLVGGAFFIAPLYDDMPDMARSIFTVNSGSPENITINMSTDSDVNAFAASMKKLNGVKDVQCNKITIRTSPFKVDDWKETLEKRIPVLESDVKSVQVTSNDTFEMYLNKNNNPTQVVKNVKEWLILVGGMDILNNIAEVSITVEPSQVDSVTSQLPQDIVVVDSISGPVEDQITAFKKNLPDKTSIVILCGLIGMFTGFIGLFIDSIYQIVDKTRTWLRERRKKLK